MKTELINNIANEAIYQLKYYRNIYLTNKVIKRILLKLNSTIFNYLIAIHVYFL